MNYLILNHKMDLHPFCGFTVYLCVNYMNVIYIICKKLTVKPTIT